MASDKATTLLTSLPLEVRHTIFNYTAARQTEPEKLLRYWFEKKETKELVAKHVADNPNDPAPQVVYHQEQDFDSEPEPEPEAEDGEDDEEEDSENDDEDDEDGEGNDNAEDEDEDAEVDQDGDVDVDAEDGEEEEIMDENDGTHIAGTGTSQTSTSVPTQSTPPQAASVTQTNAPTASFDQEDEATLDAEDEHAEEGKVTTQDGDGDAVMTGEANEAGGNDDDEEDEDEEDATDTTADAATSAPPPPPPPPAVVISPHHKWRHIPNFMRISHCPPPVELLLASKQLNEEAKNWFYDVAVLRISATSSFAHTSFFEEAFSQITEAAFSPMENIRKVEALFVWDTTWLRAEETGCAEAIFPALLRQRADFVHQILSQAPDLREVTIHWHDSAQDNESANFMLDILAPFHSLNPNVQIKEHYIAADARPHKNSIAGQRRLEFQRIVDGGLDRLF